MTLKIADYAQRRRDSVWERELARELRQLPEAERFQFINELLDYHLFVGLKLANACLRERQYFEQLLERGLATANARTILEWLECVAPRLGFRRVLLLLTQAVETDARAVGKALYWLPRFLPPHDPQARRDLRKLGELVERRGGWPVPRTQEALLKDAEKAA